MKVRYNKNQFKLMETLTGEPIDCSTCEWFTSPGSKMCIEPKTYYEHRKKNEKNDETALLSFCPNYKKEGTGNDKER